MHKPTDLEQPQAFPIEEEVRPTTLAHVNFGLFRELITLGTSRERICATLCLNNSEYDYLSHLQ